MFLPWFRAFLDTLENEISTINREPSFALPFWNWGPDSKNWYDPSAGVFTKTMLGASSGGFNDGSRSPCIYDGFMRLDDSVPQRSWITTDGDCIRRRAISKKSLLHNPLSNFTAKFFSDLPKVNPKTLRPYKSFDEFRKNIEVNNQVIFFLWF
jgi:hypothetical protein